MSPISRKSPPSPCPSRPLKSLMKISTPSVTTRKHRCRSTVVLPQTSSITLPKVALRRGSSQRWARQIFSRNMMRTLMMFLGTSPLPRKSLNLPKWTRRAGRNRGLLMRKNLSSPHRRRRKASPKKGTQFSQLVPTLVKSLRYLGSPRREADHLEGVRKSPRGRRNQISSLKSPRMSLRTTTTLWGPINTIQIICIFLTAVRESQRRRTKSRRKLELQSLHLV